LTTIPPQITKIAFLNSPCYETPNKCDKKIEQSNRGRKKTAGKKTTFFVMSPDGFFLKEKKVFIVFLNSPCYETPKKRD
jgi:hypothetical protein